MMDEIICPMDLQILRTLMMTKRINFQYAFLITCDCRILEWFELEGTLGVISFYLFPWAGMPSTISGCYKHYPTWPLTLHVPGPHHPLSKNSIPTPHPNLPSPRFKPFLLVLSQPAQAKSRSPPLLSLGRGTKVSLEPSPG